MLVRNNTEYPSVLSSLENTNPGPVYVILHFFTLQERGILPYLCQQSSVPYTAVSHIKLNFEPQFELVSVCFCDHFLILSMGIPSINMFVIYSIVFVSQKHEFLPFIKGILKALTILSISLSFTFLNLQDLPLYFPFFLKIYNYAYYSCGCQVNSVHAQYFQPFLDSEVRTMDCY